MPQPARSSSATGSRQRASERGAGELDRRSRGGGVSGPPGGSDLPSGLRSLSVTIDTSEIASPHDFGFQLRHYVVAPEVREGEKLVEIVRLGSGRLVKIDVVSAGTVDEPRLELTVFSADPLTPSDVGEARRRVCTTPRPRRASSRQRPWPPSGRAGWDTGTATSRESLRPSRGGSTWSG